MFLSAADSGIPAGVDVDGLQAGSDGNEIVVSFDTTVSFDGQVFDDEDAAGYSLTAQSWSLVFDASSVDESLRSADAQAIQFVPEPGLAVGLAAASVGLACRGRRRAGPQSVGGSIRDVPARGISPRMD
jgi:hypothetical protein